MRHFQDIIFIWTQIYRHFQIFFSLSLTLPAYFFHNFGTTWAIEMNLWPSELKFLKNRSLWQYCTCANDSFWNAVRIYGPNFGHFKTTSWFNTLDAWYELQTSLSMSSCQKKLIVIFNFWWHHQKLISGL